MIRGPLRCLDGSFRTVLRSGHGSVRSGPKNQDRRHHRACHRERREDPGACSGWSHNVSTQLLPRDHSEHAKRIATIRQVSTELGQHIGILQDLQGPKIRLGRFADGPITLSKGDPFALTSRPVSCNKTIATVTYDKLAEEVTAGSRILLDDGRVEMKVEEVDQTDQTLHCSVTVGGVLSNNKGVNFPDVQLSVRALTDKDREDLVFGLQQGVGVALSFVRNPSTCRRSVS